MLKSFINFIFKSLLFFIKIPYLIPKYILKFIWFLLTSSFSSNSSEKIYVQLQSNTGKWNNYATCSISETDIHHTMERASKSISAHHTGRIRAIGTKTKRVYEIR